jgi:hypothetical protein
MIKKAESVINPSEKAKVIYQGLTGRAKTRGKSLANRIDPLTFMRDPLLLKYEPTLGGRCFVKVAYGMPLDSEEEDFLAQEYDGSPIAARPGDGWSVDGYPECVLACGRRSTKTFMASKLALYESVTSDYRESGYIRRSERAFIVCIAQDLPAATDLAQTNIASDLSNSKQLRHMVVQEIGKQKKAAVESFDEDDDGADAWSLKMGTTKNRIVLHTGNVILSLASNSKAARGRPYPVIIVDEFAHFIRMTGTQNTDCAVLNAIKPGGSQFGKRRKIFYLSTPSGQRGEFYELYRNRNERPEQFTMHAPTWLMNPPHEEVIDGETVIRGITDEYLNGEYAINPIGFEQEYGALFIDPTYGLIPGESVDKCLDEHVPVPIPGPHPYRIMCVDPATKRDTCAMVIGHYDLALQSVVIDHCDGLEPRSISRDLGHSRQTGSIADETHDPTVENQKQADRNATTARVNITPEEMVQLTTMLYKAWGCSEVWTDQHLAPMFIPALRESGLNARSFTYGSGERKAMYMLLKTAIVGERMKIVGAGTKWAERLRGELKTVHVESTPRGDWTVKKGEKGDDFVDASAHLTRRLWSHYRIGALGDWQRYSAFGGQGGEKKVMATGDGAKPQGWREALRESREKRRQLDRTTGTLQRVAMPRLGRNRSMRPLTNSFPRPHGGSNPYGGFNGPNPYGGL